MNKREKEVIQSQLDMEEEVIERLRKQYQSALNEINRKIRILQSDELTQSKIYQLQYQEVLRAQVESILEKLHGDEFSTIQKFLSESYTNAFVGTVYSMHSQGVPLILPIDPNAAVKAVMTDSQISGGLYKALGVDVNKLKKSISSEIARGIAAGMSTLEIARNISNATKAPYSRAKTIVRTESHRVTQASRFDVQKGAKSRGIDVAKQWVSVLDGDTRTTHRKLDGQIREIDEPFELDGKKAKFPGDFGDPAEDCNCRCISSTVVKSALDEIELQRMKDRAEFFGLDKSKNLEEFKENYIKASQNPDSSIANPEKSSIIKVDRTMKHAVGVQRGSTFAADEAAKGANPHYGQPGYRINCQRCVQAYEFRRRGYNVTARPKPTTGNTVSWGSECFIKPGEDPVSAYTFGQTAASVKRELANAPDGARYSIYVIWKGRNSSAHVFIAEKENGIVRYLDPQTGNADASTYFQIGKPGRFGFFRLDDKDVTTDESTIKATVEGVTP